jgi:hypothetical protein
MTNIAQISHRIAGLRRPTEVVSASAYFTDAEGSLTRSEYIISLPECLHIQLPIQFKHFVHVSSSAFMRRFWPIMQSVQASWKFAPLNRPFTPSPSTRKLEGIVFDVDGTLW